jgi:amino acid transporter
MPSWWKDRDGLGELVVSSSVGMLVSIGLCGFGVGFQRKVGILGVFGLLGILGSLLGLLVSGAWFLSGLVSDAIRGRLNYNELSIIARPEDEDHKD